MILVIGATGRIGGDVARLLVDAGAPVRALVRDRTRAEALTARGVELAVGDLDDTSSLDRAMSGVDRVLVVSAQDLRQAELQGNAVQAAVRNDVGHIVKVSGIAPSVSPGGPAAIGRQNWRTEQDIEETGVPFALLRPGSFLQHLPDPTAHRGGGPGVLAAPMGSSPIAMVDARDIAAAAAAVLTSDEHFNRVYDITGPRAFTYQQLAGVLEDATARVVQYVDTPPALAETVLRRQGHPDWFVQHLGEMAQMFRVGAGAAVSTAVEDLTGHRPRSIEAFVAEHRAAFTPGGVAAVRLLARTSLGLAARVRRVSR